MVLVMVPPLQILMKCRVDRKVMENVAKTSVSKMAQSHKHSVNILVQIYVQLHIAD